ncbi:MAG: hypothetical protein DRJ41_05220, partial [Thermoprotei archaeon]
MNRLTMFSLVIPVKVRKGSLINRSREGEGFRYLLSGFTSRLNSEKIRLRSSRKEIELRLLGKVVLEEAYLLLFKGKDVGGLILRFRLVNQLRADKDFTTKIAALLPKIGDDALRLVNSLLKLPVNLYGSPMFLICFRREEGTHSDALSILLLGPGVERAQGRFKRYLEDISPFGGESVYASERVAVVLSDDERPFYLTFYEESLSILSALELLLELFYEKFERALKGGKISELLKLRMELTRISYVKHARRFKEEVFEVIFECFLERMGITRMLDLLSLMSSEAEHVISGFREESLKTAV